MAARQLSAEELAFYRTNGYVRVDRLITPAEVAELVADYDAAVAGEFGDLRWTGRRVEGKMVQLGNAQQVIKHWQTHNYMVHASAIARQLEGEDLGYSYDQLIMKPPHYEKETEWHQVGLHPQSRPGSLSRARARTHDRPTRPTKVLTRVWLAGCRVLAERSRVYMLAGADTHDGCIRSDAVRAEISLRWHPTTRRC